ncbi:hypothetical protein HanIR_Chr09g0436721 [Helianthus annuus]|nr:hypothetical protein HanIR_Chr09g0436721 [Helianthus annuus]
MDHILMGNTQSHTYKVLDLQVHYTFVLLICKCTHLVRQRACCDYSLANFNCW